jgi:hypothetical protein
MEKMTLQTTFLEPTRIFGHPDAENLCCSLLNVVGDKGYNLPLERLVSLASDGATFMLSPVNGLNRKLRQKRGNDKIYSQHCSTHWLVLCCKDARKAIPRWVETAIGATRDYFAGSSVRRDKFEQLQTLTDPEGQHMALVRYNKVRWLSLSQSVQRLWSVLPQLVAYFENAKDDC